MKYLIFFIFLLCMSSVKDEPHLLARVEIVELDGHLYIVTKYEATVYKEQCDVWEHIKNEYEIQCTKQSTSIKL